MIPYVYIYIHIHHIHHIHPYEILYAMAIVSSFSEVPTVSTEKSYRVRWLVVVESLGQGQLFPWKTVGKPLENHGETQENMENQIVYTDVYWMVYV